MGPAALPRVVIISLSIAASLLASVHGQKPITADVIVIGAGISGIAAARKLVQGGVKNVLVLEGRSRKGGRLQTVTVGDGTDGVKVDLGGQWITGITGNPLTALAQRYNLSIVPTSTNNTVYAEDGTEQSEALQDEVEQLTVDFLEWLEGARDDDSDEPTLNISSTLQEAFDMWASEQDLTVDAMRSLRQNLNSLIVQEYAANLANLSALYYDVDDPQGSMFEGGDAVWKQGYGSLIEALSKGLNITYNQTVTSVDYSSSPVRVVTARNVTYTAPYVICTLPLGVLQKAGAVTFTPPFSGDKAAAVKNLGMGLLMKVVMLFKEPFWVEDAPTDWINYVPQQTGNWSEFFSCYSSLGKPVMIAWAAADFAWQQENRNDSLILADVMERLSVMFPDTYEEPTAYRITRWGQESFSYGSYPYMRAGAAEKSFVDMSTPLLDRLFFAGDATHIEHFATATGAFMSGEREADRILAMIPNLKPQSGRRKSRKILKSRRLA